MRTALTVITTLSLALGALVRSVSAGSAAPAPAPAPEFRVIVHPSNPSTGLRRSFLADAYLKKVTRWPDESVIRPADLAGTAPARARFSSDVLGRPIDAVKAYWQRRIFAGQGVPPPEFARDEEVVAYVLLHPSAVGYISARVDVSGVRVIAVLP